MSYACGAKPRLLAALMLVLCSVSARGDDALEMKSAVVRHYANMALANYQDAHAEAEQLRVRIKAFLDAPSAESLGAARAAWVAARKPYLQAEVFRFYEGPIDQVENRINAWPVDETYIDYVQEDRSAGIISHPELYPAITRELIESLNEKEGEKSISCGFHAIEFLLWGQDHDAKGPGNRPFQDYLTGDAASAPNAGRRREYLRLISEVLVADLQKLSEQWSENRPDNYRTWFLAAAPHKTLRMILHGMGALSATELAGERLTVPYETKEQEDEHSCFSDTTSNDAVYDAIGIQNVYLGRYTRIDGTKLEGGSLAQLLRQVDPVLAEKLEKQIEASVQAARSIPQPFDQAMLGDDAAPGRAAIHRTIRNLQHQGDLIAKAAAQLSTRDAD